MGFVSQCRVALLVFLLFNLTQIRIMLRYNSSRSLSQFLHKMPTLARVTATPATPTDTSPMVSNLQTSSRLKMAISKHTIVLLLKIELNNNKWECIMENHKLHIWFHQAQIMVKCFQLANNQPLKSLVSLKHLLKLV